MGPGTLIPSHCDSSPEYNCKWAWHMTHKFCPSRHHILYRRLTNINVIPFRSFRLRMTLGPANPRLINSAEEPWFIRRCGFSPHCAATLPKTLISIRSTRPQSLASTQTLRRVTTSSFDGLKYRYPILAPSLFPARKLDQWSVTNSFKDGCF